MEIEAGRAIVAAKAGRLSFADGRQSARFDLVVDALGARSPLAEGAPAPLRYGALWASLDWAGAFDDAALEQRYEAARKMVGVMPIGKLTPHARPQAAFFWSLRHQDRAAWRERALDDWKQEALARLAVAPLVDQIKPR